MSYSRRYFPGTGRRKWKRGEAEQKKLLLSFPDWFKAPPPLPLTQSGLGLITENSFSATDLQTVCPDKNKEKRKSNQSLTIRSVSSFVMASATVFSTVSISPPPPAAGAAADTLCCGTWWWSYLFFTVLFFFFFTTWFSRCGYPDTLSHINFMSLTAYAGNTTEPEENATLRPILRQLKRIRMNPYILIMYPSADTLFTFLPDTHKKKVSLSSLTANLFLCFRTRRYASSNCRKILPQIYQPKTDKKLNMFLRVRKLTIVSPYEAPKEYSNDPSRKR